MRIEVKGFLIVIFEHQRLFLDVAGVFGNLQDIFKVSVVENAAIQETSLTLVTMRLQNLSRISVRLPVRSPPSSLALTLITNNDFVAGLDAFIATEPVLEIRAFFASLSAPTEDANPNRPVIRE